MTALQTYPHEGMHDPIRRTPTRRPGSVRRTTVTDMLRPDGMSGVLVLRGSGRDIRTGADGEVVVLGRAGLDVGVDFLHGRSVATISSEPAEPALHALVGASASSGFRRAVTAAVPEHAAARTLLYQLLDDVPVTSLISGYAVSAVGLSGTLASAGVTHRADICAGFQSGGTMMQLIADRGSVPPVFGPVAPDVERADPEGWHDVPELPPRAMRRRRLLDVWRGELFGVHAWFRDSFQRPDGDQTIVHEYHIDAQVEPGSWRIIEISATPHVLPWSECPQAAASAERLRGATLHDLRDEVRAGFVGTATCTHLNDQLRSLTDVLALAEACDHLT
jgi:hypothetical protein